MTDSHLNSIHLEFPRREHFRQAREALLSSRGMQTISLENGGDEWESAGSHTMIQSLHQGVPAGVHYWLMDKEGIYPLKVGVNTIGRLPDNDVVLPVPYVSRRHCAILVHSGHRCELHDIASKNGTFLNGQRLQGPTPLKSGDEITMCDRQFVFLSKDAPQQDDASHGQTLTH